MKFEPRTERIALILPVMRQFTWRQKILLLNYGRSRKLNSPSGRGKWSVLPVLSSRGQSNLKTESLLTRRRVIKVSPGLTTRR